MSTSRKPTANQSQEWDACDTGTLSGLGQRLRKEHARVTQKRLGGGALAATAAIALAVALWPSNPTPPTLSDAANWPGGLACSECLKLMPAYHDQLVSAETDAAASLSAADAEAVAAHLEGCPVCREHFEEIYPGVLAAATAGIGLLGFATRRRIRG